jgi:tetratricopeptide (TPR) repeat protein
MKKSNLLIAFVMMAAIGGGIAALPRTLAAQAAAQASPFKDRAEYDAYNAITQAKEPDKQIEAADKYLAAYPQTKMAENVYAIKLQAYQRLNNVPKVEETAAKLLEVNPKNLNALVLLSTIFPQTFNPQDPAADQKLAAAADHAKAGLEQLAALQKPAQISDDDFKKQKDQLESVFHHTAGFVSLQKKDYDAAQQELHKSVELNPGDAVGVYQLGVSYLSAKPAKYDPGMWALAHAISVTGPAALPAAMQTQVKDYLGKVYEGQHGSKDGLDELLTKSASATFPPQDFHIKTVEELPQAAPEPAPKAAAKRELTVKAEELTSYDVIVKYLQAGGQKSDDTWEILKGTELTLPGKVISATPAARPKTVNLAVAPELQTQDVKFDVEVTLAAPLAKAPAKGENMAFVGTVDSYRAKPFLLKLADAKVAK